VRLLAAPKAVVIFIECDDPEPSRIVSFSKQRNPQRRSEDHVRIVLDTAAGRQCRKPPGVSVVGAAAPALFLMTMTEAAASTRTITKATNTLTGVILVMS